MPLPADLASVAWLAADDIAAAYGFDVERGRVFTGASLTMRTEFERVIDSINRMMEEATPERIAEMADAANRFCIAPEDVRFDA